jgi:sulfur relay (sulfurtransferase) DsrF/TusC family protein
MKKVKFVLSEAPVSVGWDQVGVSVFFVEAQITDAEGMKLVGLGMFPTEASAHEGVKLVSNTLSQLGFSIE